MSVVELSAVSLAISSTTTTTGSLLLLSLPLLLPLLLLLLLLQLDYCEIQDTDGQGAIQLNTMIVSVVELSAVSLAISSTTTSSSSLLLLPVTTTSTTTTASTTTTSTRLMGDTGYRLSGCHPTQHNYSQHLVLLRSILLDTSVATQSYHNYPLHDTYGTW